MTAVYTERGASWWPVLWGPGFAAVGLLVESLTPGPLNAVMWVLLGTALAATTAIWVYGRRRLCTVRLTSSALIIGEEELPISRIVSVADVEVPVGAHVLGGGAIAPRGTGEVPLRLDDEQVVIAWSKHPEALTKALRACL